MKNLELLELTHKNVGDLFSGAKIFAQLSNTTYFIDNSLYKHDFQTNSTTELCPQAFENAILIKFLQIENKICVVTPQEIHIFDPEGELQTVNFDHDIAAISWNPTEELVAVVSTQGDVATYSIDYENGVVFPQGKSSINAQIPDTVYVGWGSKDTQFRGSEGKLKKNEAPVEIKPVEDEIPVISWRGNGEMFVVNYFIENQRKFIVFETPCQALFKSEECLGLQPPVAWRPSGNMIATISEANNRQSVVIFEKNGQKRFNFNLNFEKVKINGVKWSPCAQILTLHTTNLETESQTLHLLTSSNYKWYEKQTLIFKNENPLLDFEWLETNQFIFILRVITKKEIVRYTFRNVIHNSSGLCAVIDGKNLQITDFNDSIVPPIMSLKQMTNANPINFVAFDQNSIMIVDSQNQLKIIDHNGGIVKSIDLEESNFPLSSHHFIFSNDQIDFASENDSETVIYRLDHLNDHSLNFITAVDQISHLLKLDQSVYGLKAISSNLYVNDSEKPVKLQVCQNHTCQLFPNCHFYLNDHKLSDCVNSFLIFDSYLLYTTKLSELFCFRLTDDNYDQNYRRSIEQGATLIAAISNSPKVVLQLPRGNLETISCRLISIDILDRLLNDDRWEEAIRFIRLEKLNSNLLFDLNSDRFLGKIDRFIQSVKTINELNALCLEFEEGNVLRSIYKDWGKCGEFSGKIDAIFGALFEYFDSVDYVDYISTIMMVNLNFFTLRRALIYLQDLLRRSYDDVTLKQKLIDAIQTLKTYGCDQDKLYTESLLLYDLDLAHFVASCCQLDPRIYEPHITNLKNLPEVEKRYTINLYAKKPKAAIKYLLRTQTSPDTILTFIKTHNVSREAYENLPSTNPHYQTVSRAFAQDLSRRGFHKEAGTILKRAQLLEEALEEWKLGLDWKGVMDLVGELEWGEVERIRVASEMAGRLVQAHLIKEGAFMYEFHAKNYEMAVKVLLGNCLFEEAMHVAKKNKRGDIIVSEVIPLLLAHKKYLEEKLTDLNEMYKKHKLRLNQVRKDRVHKLTHPEYEEDRDDLFSDIASTTTKSSRSSRSRSSTASSRNRRKEERKKQDLREGGIYEDIALIRALYCTIKEIYSKGDEVRSCCLLLLEESDVGFGEVKQFHDFYLGVCEGVKNGVGEIWPPHFSGRREGLGVEEMADLENYEHLDVEYRTPPNSNANWKLNLF